MAEDTSQIEKPRRSRPTKILPTERIRFDNQLGIIRGFAVISTDPSRAVHAKEVAKLVGLSDGTAALATPFLTDIGLLIRTNEGFLPSEAVRSYKQADDWKADNPAHKLAPVFRNSWLGQLIVPRVQFKPLEIEAALQLLAEHSGAGPEYRSQLEVILDYLEAVGLVARIGTQLSPGPTALPSSPPPLGGGKPDVVSGTEEPRENAREKPEAPPPARRDLGVGAISFSIDVQVSMSDLAGWSPERISAFFAGIAQVLAAKGQEKP